MVEPNEGGQPLDGLDGNDLGVNLGADGGLIGDAGGDENVDQYFDDGGETFLPADHVSNWKESSFIIDNALWFWLWIFRNRTVLL